MKYAFFLGFFLSGCDATSVMPVNWDQVMLTMKVDHVSGSEGTMGPGNK